jgi:DNA-binding NarL/FixJ family response regulator
MKGAGNRRILLAIGHRLFGQCLELVLSWEGFEVVGPARSLAEVRDLLAAEREVDAALVAFPEGEAVVAVRELSEAGIGVVALAGMDSDAAECERVLCAGARSAHGVTGSLREIVGALSGTAQRRCTRESSRLTDVMGELGYW